MESLEGRVALITGAGAGIGAATARLLARNGVKLALASRRGQDPGVEGAPTARPRLFGIAHDMRDFRHGGERIGVDLRRAAGDDNARVRPLALELSDRLPRLAG